MGWHADDEPELGNQPVIASLSLGAERDFVMRCRDDEIVNKQYIKLQHGSLLLMAGDTQRYWQHSLPKRRKISEPRINLTFRLIRPGS
jgi:alkylated DNA repair dioxygenase AlkB